LYPGGALSAAFFIAFCYATKSRVGFFTLQAGEVMTTKSFSFENDLAITLAKEDFAPSSVNSRCNF
jgi:hypothetical protein